VDQSLLDALVCCSGDTLGFNQYFLGLNSVGFSHILPASNGLLPNEDANWVFLPFWFVCVMHMLIL
jgi:hypothetical protein